MFDKLQNPLSLAGRILVIVLFAISGVGKITGYTGMLGYMASHGLPMVEVLLPLSILVEVGGSIMIALGLFARQVALVMFLFIIPVTLAFHSGSDMASQINFLKNLSIMGAMLLIVAFGPGAWSLDARRKH